MSYVSVMNTQTPHALDAYRKRHQIPQGVMAQRLGVTRSHLWKITNWKHLPSMRWVAVVIRETDGEVTANDFLRHLI